jgi:hypothetical protein
MVVRAPLERTVQRDLVERAETGDRESFGVLADASIARLFNPARLVLANHDLAQDAVQEALVIAWRRLRVLRDPDRPTRKGTPRPGGRTGRRKKLDGGPDRIRTGDLQRDRLACWAATPRVRCGPAEDSR